MQTLRDPPLERPCDCADIPFAQPVFDQGSKQGPEIQFVAGKRKRIGRVQRRTARELLEPHRGLSFESDFPCEPEQGCGGVEEPSDRSGSKRPDVLADQFHGIPVACWKTEGSGGEM